MDITVKGKEYAWGSIDIRVDGVRYAGCRGIDYTDDEQQDFARGQGSKPLGIQRGDISYSGTLTLLQYELVALVAKSATGRIQDLPPANIAVTYSNEAGDIVVDMLIGVKFSRLNKGAKSGDLTSEKELPFLFVDLKLNA